MMSFFSSGISYLSPFVGREPIVVGDWNMEPGWDQPLIRDIRVIEAFENGQERFC
jgi:hypothetical protein